MEFHSYPMDVQTLRIQFAACVFIIGLHITINMNNIHFVFLAKKKKIARRGSKLLLDRRTYFYMRRFLMKLLQCFPFASYIHGR